MTTFLFDLVAAAAQGTLLCSPVQGNVAPRNEVERLVLARDEGASRVLEGWLAGHADTAATSLAEAGFRRIREEAACVNYAYSRQIGPKLDRGASIVICPGERPFVLRTDEGRGPFVAPPHGPPGPVTVPIAPRP